MRALLIIQGEGRGHLSQAIAYCEKHDIRVEKIIISDQRDIPNDFIQKFKNVDIIKLPSLNFKYSKNKINLSKTLLYNIKMFPKFIKGLIRTYKEMSEIDLVLNFYEPLSMVSVFRKVIKHSISNQYLFFHKYWRVEKNLSYYLVYVWSHLTKIGSSEVIAPSFRYLPNHKKVRVIKPLINKDIKKLKPTKGKRILVYLFDTCLIEDFIDKIDHDEKYDLFIESTDYVFPSNVKVHTLSRKSFLNKLEKCKKVICSGGFQLISEAKYLKKEIDVIPLHYEQRMNKLNLDQ